MCNLRITNQQPLHRHDCDNCVFLGQFDGAYGRTDLYMHPSPTPALRTVIARYDSEGSQYVSGMPFAYGRIADLTEARLRAEQRGLLDYDIKEALEYASPRSASRETMRKLLPFTLEYQAFLAHEAGNTLRAEALVRHMFALDRKSWPNGGAGEVLMDFDTRLHKVVTTFRQCTPESRLAIGAALAKMTAFLWDELEPELDAAWQSFLRSL